MNEMKTGDLNRVITVKDLDRAVIDEENRTVRLSFSSESPVERWFGNEVLDHSPESVRMERLENSAPLLWNHDTSDQIGVVENAKIEGGRGYATVRFSKKARAEDFFQDVIDGIAANISVGYRIHEMEQSEDAQTFRATDWEPHEISLVSAPADFTVGVARTIGEHTTRVISNQPEPQIERAEMSEENTIDVQSVKDEAREEALNAERSRVSTITDMVADAPYLRELGDKALREGMPLDGFQREAFEVQKREIAKKPAPEVTAPATVDMSAKERASFSVMRALQASISGNWSQAGLEKEVSDTIAARAGETTGFYLPQNTPWGKRDLTVGTDNQGGYLVGTEHRAQDFVEALRAKMVVGQAGGTYLTGLTSNVAIPTIATGTAVEWVAEGAAPTEGQPVFGTISLTPKNLVGYVQITRNLILQSSPQVESVIEDDITNGLAVGLDAAALAGSGSSNQPTGILSTSGIGSVSFSSSGAPTFAEIVSVESAITVDNADSNNMYYVTTPALAGTLKTTTKDSGSGQFISENGLVNGYPILHTSSVTANNIILGSFSDLIVAQFGAVEVLSDVAPSTGITTLALHLHADIGVRHAQSFAKGA